MVFEMSNRNAMISELKLFASCLPKDRVNPKIFNAVKRIANVFNEKCTGNSYFIECDSKELDVIFRAVMEKIFSERFICVCAFVGGNFPVDSISRLRELCSDARYCEIIPTESTDKTVRMYISYLHPEYSRVLDPDYVIRCFFSD